MSEQKSISEVARELFIQLKEKDTGKMKLVNEWITRNSSHPNLPIFLTKSAEADKKQFCVMLKKALDADDFSAFEGGATPPTGDKGEDKKDGEDKKPDPKPEPDESDKDKGEDKPEPKPEPEKKPAKKDKPKPEPEPGPAVGGLVDDAVRTIAGAIVAKKINEALADRKGGGESVSEDDIRRIVREEIRAHFQRIVSGG